MTPAAATEFWYLALAEPIGLLLQVSDPSRAKQALYQARAKVQDQKLDGLQIRQWPEAGPGGLVIVHRQIQLSAKKD